MDYLKKNYPLKCLICKKAFLGHQKNQKACSEVCRRNRMAKITGRYADKSISSGTVGAISEMAVAIFLMSRGYSVFRALSPACLCDLIAIKEDKITRVEVRTGYEDEKGKITYPSGTKDKGRQDFFAIYLRRENKVRFFTYEKQEIFNI